MSPPSPVVTTRAPTGSPANPVTLQFLLDESEFSGQEEAFFVLKDGEPAELAGVGHVIVHKEFALEILHSIQTRVGSTAPRQLVEHVSARVAEHCGPPVHEDAFLRVYRGPGE